MQLTIKKQEEKPLTERQELVIKVASLVTPSNAQVKEKISELKNCPQNLVIIKKIDQLYGTQESIITAYVYKNEAALKTFEPKSKSKEKKEG